MQKFLLHSSLANYDAVSKRWTFALEKRLSNPTRIRLRKATYSTPGDVSPHPQVVYLRSNALARMITRKHTMELRSVGHENASNVIATLTETHTRGRYRIVGGQTFPVNPNQSERNIDLYFTDGDTVLDGARFVLVLEDLVDHANVGAAFRSGAALGVDAVLLGPRCADPLYRRAVKVSMGAVFALPWTRVPDWYDALPTLAGHGFTSVALTLAPDAVPLEEAVAGLDRIALVLGSEGHGLTSRWEQSADRRAIIPMAAGIDSLNVAAAAAVACYVTARR